MTEPSVGAGGTFGWAGCRIESIIAHIENTPKAADNQIRFGVNSIPKAVIASRIRSSSEDETLMPLLPLLRLLRLLYVVFEFQSFDFSRCPCHVNMNHSHAKRRFARLYRVHDARS